MIKLWIQVRNPNEAQKLLEEVDAFLKPREAKQEEKIRKISELAIQLYGLESSQHINSVLKENRNMIDSFAVINTELSSLAFNLKAAEEERLKHVEVLHRATKKNVFFWCLSFVSKFWTTLLC